MIVARFYCACGYGPFEVEDNRDAPIPAYAIPVSIHHDDAEGRPLGECPGCGDELPQFVNRQQAAAARR